MKMHFYRSRVTEVTAENEADAGTTARVMFALHESDGPCLGLRCNTRVIENPLRLVPGSLIESGGDKFPYRGIGSSRLDYGDEIRYPSRLLPGGTNENRRRPFRANKDVGANEVIIIDEITVDEIMKAEKRMKV
ncbi:hypothetical protein EVAR_103223_1 [Eumeta japonica]|uniref:Uncharacterized protein n=1 Tax=Eumeta variegata TaxID=151549 RepID=A0A4C1XAH9_EUMVA|nr:hypothetical protein EVAR_103223_1 [Eumeta japonica]